MKVTRTVELTRAEQDVMRVRCEEEGHAYENGLTALFQFVLVCKWCGDRR